MNGSKANKKKTMGGTDSSAAGVDLRQVERVLEFMASHHLEEFEYAHGGFHIRLKRALAVRAAAPVYEPIEEPAESQSSNSSKSPSVAASAQAIVPASTPPAKEELHIIKSPIVGTFYASPSPDAPPFVKVGDSIQSGQVVCIVEAMKLMNEIEADMGGEVVGVLAENGQPVEYGQSLFALRPAKKK
jgi:acetyl-CoA carboxylase biotin carboxyl carrier protein